VLGIRRAIRSAADRSWLVMALAWFVGPLVGFSLAVGKQDHYILPILPAAAIFTALAFEYFLASSSEKVRQAGRRLVVAHGVFILIAGIVGVALYVTFWADAAALARIKAVQNFLRPEIFDPVLAISVIGLLGGGLTWFLARRRLLHVGLAALAVTFAAAYLWSWPTLQGPMDRAQVAATFGRQVRAAVGDAPVFAFNGTNATVIFYAGRSMPEIPPPPPGFPSGDGVFNPDSAERGWLIRMQNLNLPAGPWFLVCAEKNLDDLGRWRSSFEPVLHEVDPWHRDGGFWLLKHAGRPAQ
jgi:4-amino-4-deoxy-L-arabinose transferase-like glycosyltransferase